MAGHTRWGEGPGPRAGEGLSKETQALLAGVLARHCIIDTILLVQTATCSNLLVGRLLNQLTYRRFAIVRISPLSACRARVFPSKSALDEASMLTAGLVGDTKVSKRQKEALLADAGAST